MGWDPNACGQDQPDFGRRGPERGEDDAVSCQRRAGAARARARQMNVHVVAFEANDVEFTPVSLHERADDLSADALDLFLRTLVHDGCACGRKVQTVFCRALIRQLA